MLKFKHTIFTCKPFVTNSRHVDDLKFVHVTARTDRLHHNPIHAFPQLWEELPVTFRSDLVVRSLETFVKNLKRQVCC